jgi:hypothetical protein
MTVIAADLHLICYFWFCVFWNQVQFTSLQDTFTVTIYVA